MSKIDIRLERDPRFAAAKAKLYELQSEVTALERQRDDASAGLASTMVNHAARIEQEASALLSGGPAFVPEREALTRTLNELTHRLAVTRQAVVMQREIVEGLRAEVGNVIAAESLPQHQANVRAMAKALIQLNAAAETEYTLRRTLIDALVPLGDIRAMPVPGLGRLSESTSRAAGWLIEAYEYGFVDLGTLPENLHSWAKAKKAKPTPPAPMPVTVDSDGWGDA